MKPIDLLFANLAEMIRDGMADGQSNMDKLVSNIYMEIGEYHSEPDVYGLPMDPEEQEDCELTGFEDYELCPLCQNSIPIGSNCSFCEETTRRDEK